MITITTKKKGEGGKKMNVTQADVSGSNLYVLPTICYECLHHNKYRCYFVVLKNDPGCPARKKHMDKNCLSWHYHTSGLEDISSRQQGSRFIVSAPFVVPLRGQAEHRNVLKRTCLFCVCVCLKEQGAVIPCTLLCPPATDIAGDAIRRMTPMRDAGLGLGQGWERSDEGASVSTIKCEYQHMDEAL